MDKITAIVLWLIIMLVMIGKSQLAFYGMVGYGLGVGLSGLVFDENDADADDD
jgi:hypothetical protein